MRPIEVSFLYQEIQLSINLQRKKTATLYVAITLVNGTTLYQIYRLFYFAYETDKFRLFLLEPEPNGTLGLTFYLFLSESPHLQSGNVIKQIDR